MMDWTDRHCRFFLRQFSPHTLLYTEMINAQAILRGNASRLLKYSVEEQPLAIQLGGSDVSHLALAAAAAEDAGYVEINLNCGCPSDRVHAGAFGACLMLQPARVADCVAAMKSVVNVPVTVKFRVGVIDRDAIGGGAVAMQAVERFDEADFQSLHEFASAIAAAGADALIVHARKAVLGGLSPHENRSVPPLRFDVVKRLRAALSQLPVIVNGGVRTCEAGLAALQDFDGVMIGREAYHRPALLAELQAQLRPAGPVCSTTQVLDAMQAYALREMAAGTRLSAISRHMLGLLSGSPGARQLRQLLSRDVQSGADVNDVFSQAKAIAARAM